MKPYLFNCIKFIGPDEKQLSETLILLFINNSIPYTIDDEGIISFYVSKVLDLDSMLELSKQYPETVFFWTCVNEFTMYQVVFRLMNGEILKHKLKTAAPN